MNSAVRVLMSVGFAALVATPHQAHAWGANGHRLIAELAEAKLPAATRAKVQELLKLEPGATLVSIATWADETRSPSTAAWHYVNFARGGDCTYEQPRDCPEGKCVVEALERNLAVLASAQPAEERLTALKWVVHLVGDVHQPLHAGFADDKGGNLFQLRAFNRGTNLHSLWDGGVILNWPGGEEQLRAAVTTAAAPQAVGEPSEWASEACRVAAAPDFYPEERMVPDSYFERWRPVIAERLNAAAARLAVLLAKTL